MTVLFLIVHLYLAILHLLLRIAAIISTYIPWESPLKPYFQRDYYEHFDRQGNPL